MATYDLTQGIPDKIVKGDILNCPYSGGVITLPLKKGTYKLECWGAQGGYFNDNFQNNAGKGGYSIGYLKLLDETSLFLVTGGYPGKSTTGGYNGGASGGSYCAGGGGASDIRISSNSLFARAIVAGAGGGNGYGGGGEGGGYGGGLTGGKGADGISSAGGGEGGTQTSGGGGSGSYGSFGQGGRASEGGGGGGGWYGGGSGVTGTHDSAGGGGSGYVYTSETALNYPSGCLLNSAYYLIDASTVGGNTTIILPDGTNATGNPGNGYIRITVISLIQFFFKQNDIWINGEKIYLKENGAWTESESVDSSKFAKIILPIPQAYGSTTFEYDTLTKSIQSKQYLPNYMSVTDNSSSIPGDHFAEYQFTNPKAEWSDTTRTNKTIPWDIRMKKIQCDSGVTYTGSEVSPNITNYYPSYITLNGTSAATNVGNYSFTAILNDGLKWTDGTDSTLTYNWSITGIPQRFVCAAGEKRGFYSLNGTTWTEMSNISSSEVNPRGVAYGNGRFVCIGLYGNTYYSTDGTSWVTGSGVGDKTYCYNGVFYCNDRFICVGSKGRSYYSTDGSSWTVMTGLNSSYYYYGAAYGNGKWVCVGQSGSSYYSIDGESWVETTGLDTSETYRCVIYGNDRFICVGSGGSAYYSIDGISWINMTGLDTSNYYVSIAYGNGRFICVGGNYGVAYYSIDGETWHACNAFPSYCSDLYAIAYGNGRFICGGHSGISYYSTDGLNWTEMPTMPNSSYILGIAFG